MRKKVKKLEIIPFTITHYGSVGAHQDIEFIKPIAVETSSGRRAKKNVAPLYLNWRKKRYPDKRNKNENNPIPRN